MGWRVHFVGYAVPFVIPNYLVSDKITDTMETYFDSHIDLLQRNLQKHSDRLKSKADLAFKIDSFKIRTPSGELLSKEVLSENFDREVKNFKLKVRGCCCIEGGDTDCLVIGLETHGVIDRFMAVR